MPRLGEKTVIVTGAGRGYGRSFAEAAAREGARVVLVSRTLSECAEVARRLSDAGAAALPLQADIANEDDVSRMVDAALSKFGTIDVLVNNAGYPGSAQDLTEISLEEWRQTFSVNVHGPFLCTRAVLGHMYGRRSGHIVNVTSGTSAWPRHRHFRSVPYTVTKAAIDGFSWTLSVRCEPHGVKVNAFIPGLAETRLLADMPKGFLSGKRCQTVEHVQEPFIDLLTADYPSGEPFDALKWLGSRGLLEKYTYVHE